MSAESGGGPGHLYRDRKRLWLKVAILVYALLVGTMGLIVAVIAGQVPVAVILIVAGAEVAVIGIAGVLVSRSGIRVDADGVTIISVYGFRRYRPWSQVRMFQVQRGTIWRGRVPYGVWVVCHDGQPVTTSSCVRSVPINKDSCPDVITRLAADLEAERQRLGTSLSETGLG